MNQQYIPLIMLLSFSGVLSSSKAFSGRTGGTIVSEPRPAVC